MNKITKVCLNLCATLILISTVAFGMAEDEDIHERFLKGKLIYKPNKDNDVGKIELRIADLANPLEGEFDLSKCADVGQYLSINTGYRKGFRSENKDKIEIWFTPRFLVDRELSTMAGNHYLRSIITGGDWDAARAPIGIFWTWGGWNEANQMSYCDSLTSKSMDEMGSENLLKRWSYRDARPETVPAVWRCRAAVQNFHISFVLDRSERYLRRNSELTKQLALMEEEIKKLKAPAVETGERVELRTNLPTCSSSSSSDHYAPIPDVARGYEAIYERFLNGKLIYRPNKENDIGKIELRIADLANPLKGEFDLSKCEDAGQYLSINTGYRKGFRPENANKVEIWFTPWFLVNKEMPQLPSNHHMRVISRSWDASRAPIGIFWTWGGWCDSTQLADCNSLTAESIAGISSGNLYSKYLKVCGAAGRSCFDCLKGGAGFRLGRSYPFTFHLGTKIGMSARYPRRNLKAPAVETEERVAHPITSSIPDIARSYEAIYERFLNGKLIYRPNEENDIGKIELRIADLANPLEGEFDLSKCGDAGQYLSINTGYRKGFRSENKDKVEIWFTPRFLVDRELSTMARNHYLRSIITVGAWYAARAPIGIFWTWGGWSDATLMADCDYLISESMDVLGSENLYKKYQKAWSASNGIARISLWSHTSSPQFSHFVYELK